MSKKGNPNDPTIRPDQRYYAVKVGRVPGIYLTWAECKEQVHRYHGALYKSFYSKDAAECYMRPREKFKYKKVVAPYAFVDGSYHRDTKTYGYGVCLSDGQKMHLYAGSGNDPDLVKLRNVSGETKAAMVAVEKAEELGLKEITILYDYIGIEAWAVGYFGTKIQYVQGYIDFMNSPERKVKIKYKRVPAHTGVAGNEIADILARNASGHEISEEERELLRNLDTVTDMKTVMDLQDFFTAQSAAEYLHNQRVLRRQEAKMKKEAMKELEKEQKKSTS
jgi:ribonuclease HI